MGNDRKAGEGEESDSKRMRSRKSNEEVIEGGSCVVSADGKWAMKPKKRRKIGRPREEGIMGKERIRATGSGHATGYGFPHIANAGKGRKSGFVAESRADPDPLVKMGIRLGHIRLKIDRALAIEMRRRSFGDMVKGGTVIYEEKGMPNRQKCKRKHGCDSKERHRPNIAHYIKTH